MNAPHAFHGMEAKMRTLAELETIAADARAAGQTVVLAHGVFDLLHMGHVRHLREARSHGTLLVVTLTPDRFVNKGPNRPVFTETLRMEMLASLAFVDYVAINEGPTAEPALAAVRPDVYVKGPDYVDATQDVTGKINDERRLVERNGGRIAFTDDITFSSTELINRHLNPYAPIVREFLEELRAAGEGDAIKALVDKAAGLRVLVVGDAIIDEYRYVRPMSKTPKENLIATLHQSQELFAGGALATANHVASLCAEVEVLTVLGPDDDHEDFIAERLKPNVRLRSLRRRAGPTTRKCRYVDAGTLRKLFEVYHMDDTPLDDELAAELNAVIAETAKSFDLVIVNDFGHGMIGPSTVRTLQENARFLAVNTQTNSANFGYNLITKYTRADYVCIDTAEARLAAADKVSPVETLVEEVLARRVDCPKMVVTQAAHGCTGFARGEPPCSVPALADRVIDTVGAGDAFLAITAPLMALGGALRHVAFVGNVAGALKVGIVGHRESVDKASLVKSIVTLLR